MRLLTYGMLQCHSRTCGALPSNDKHLSLQDIDLVNTPPVTFNPAFISSIVDPQTGRTDIMESVLFACHALGINTTDFDLKKWHNILLEIDITSGSMHCSNCSHTYPIEGGIPNMLLRDDEV